MSSNKNKIRFAASNSVVYASRPTREVTMTGHEVNSFHLQEQNRSMNNEEMIEGEIKRIDDNSQSRKCISSSSLALDSSQRFGTDSERNGIVRSTSEIHQYSAPTSDPNLRRSQTRDAISDTERKTVSDSLLHSSHRRKGTRFGLQQSNATFSLVQRSGKDVIRETINVIDQSVDAYNIAKQQINIDVAPISPQIPISECTTLATSSRDSYYRVVIGRMGGIQAVIRAMCAFPNSKSLQVCACEALASLCELNASNQLITYQSGGINTIIEVIQLHQGSIDVQSAAVYALVNASSHNPAALEFIRTRTELPKMLEGLTDSLIAPFSRRCLEILIQRLNQT